jgi:hypothetical protein
MIRRLVLNPVFWVSSVVGFLTIVLFSFVGFHYPKVIEDEPLVNPVKIIKIDGSTLYLADGRTLILEDGFDDDWKSIFSQSDFYIDIDAFSDHGDAVIYARQDGWICGTPWARPIRIPIIPDIVFKNRREPVAFGKFSH